MMNQANVVIPGPAKLMSQAAKLSSAFAAAPMKPPARRARPPPLGSIDTSLAEFEMREGARGGANADPTKGRRRGQEALCSSPRLHPAVQKHIEEVDTLAKESAFLGAMKFTPVPPPVPKPTPPAAGAPAKKNEQPDSLGQSPTLSVDPHEGGHTPRWLHGYDTRKDAPQNTAAFAAGGRWKDPRKEPMPPVGHYRPKFGAVEYSVMLGKIPKPHTNRSVKVAPAKSIPGHAKRHEGNATNANPATTSPKPKEGEPAKEAEKPKPLRPSHMFASTTPGIAERVVPKKLAADAIYNPHNDNTVQKMERCFVDMSRHTPRKNESLKTKGCGSHRIYDAHIPDKNIPAPNFKRNSGRKAGDPKPVVDAATDFYTEANQIKQRMFFKESHAPDLSRSMPRIPLFKLKQGGDGEPSSDHDPRGSQTAFTPSSGIGFQLPSEAMTDRSGAATERKPRGVDFSRMLGHGSATARVNDLEYDVRYTAVTPRVPNTSVSNTLGHQSLERPTLTHNISIDPPSLDPVHSRMTQNVEFAKCLSRDAANRSTEKVRQSTGKQDIQSATSPLTSPRLTGNPMMHTHVSRTVRERTLSPKKITADTVYTSNTHSMQPPAVHGNVSFEKVIPRDKVFGGRSNPTSAAQLAKQVQSTTPEHARTPRMR